MAATRTIIVGSPGLLLLAAAGTLVRGAGEGWHASDAQASGPAGGGRPARRELAGIGLWAEAHPNPFRVVRHDVTATEPKKSWSKQSKLSKVSKSTKKSKGAKPTQAKRSKGSKSCDKPSGGERAIAFLAPAAGYEGGLQPSGTAAVTYNPDGSFLLTLDAAGLDPACVDDPECRVSITQGTACDVPFGGDPADPDHYARGPFVEDPWGAVTYAASAAGHSNSAWRVDNGHALDGNLGRAVVVRRGTARVGCGVLAPAGAGLDRDVVLAAEVARYPGYAGDVAARGAVTVAFRADGTFRVRYDLGGLEARCAGCGLHIHAGTSCADAQDVLDHGWNTGLVQDLWKAAGGATYASDFEGVARGHFELYNGYSYGKNLGHAVVVHGQDGTRVGCGVLRGAVAGQDNHHHHHHHHHSDNHHHHDH